VAKNNIGWFFSEIKKAAKDFSYGAFVQRKDPFIGGLFFFRYEAKHRETLPYWDKFPCVIPISIEPGSFLAINLHYLPIPERVALLSSLLKYKVTKTNREYLNISYKMLSTASKADKYKVCIKRYLFPYLRSRFIKVDDINWEKAARLPVAQWQNSRPY
jgi:hypothetical protein